MRYHISIYFPIQHEEKLNNFCKLLNNLKWKYSDHYLERLNARQCDLFQLKSIIDNLKLTPEKIYEYYIDDKAHELQSLNLELVPFGFEIDRGDVYSLN